ncbi:MAG: hypothetical protein P4M11_15645 [Candidatus Pacebacteria bacterium]|nr:hypothetical protein [Candidatus Paceibacterota bacterium]
MASHQQIVQVEEDLNLDDGATPVSLVYKNKYMENEVTIINYSFAIIEFVVKMLQIIGYDSPAIDPISANFSSDTQALYNRTRDFLIYNGNVSLRLESEQIMDKYLGILKDKADSGKLVYLEV